MTGLPDPIPRQEKNVEEILKASHRATSPHLTERSGGSYVAATEMELNVKIV